MIRAQLGVWRFAAAALMLAAGGCANTAIEGLDALHDPGPSIAFAEEAGARGVALPPNSDGSSALPHDSETGGTTLAMLSMPPPETIRHHKPTTGRPPICGRLDPGGNARGTVASAGMQFAIECFRAKADSAAPAVIILHGAGGIGHNTIYARLAQQLVERGQSAFIFEYLAPVDQPPARPLPKGAAGRTPGGAATKAAIAARRRGSVNAEEQARAIESAVTAIRALDYVDEQEIGLFGLSLGGFHALALASRDPGIGAVVDMFGAMPRPVAPTVQRMPPTLVLHGDRDVIVPVRRAQELAKLLDDVGAVHEVKIYKGQGHSFTGAADQDSVMRSVDFFDRWLQADAAVGRAQ